MLCVLSITSNRSFYSPETSSTPRVRVAAHNKYEFPSSSSHVRVPWPQTTKQKQVRSYVYVCVVFHTKPLFLLIEDIQHIQGPILGGMTLRVIPNRSELLPRYEFQVQVRKFNFRGHKRQKKMFLHLYSAFMHHAPRITEEQEISQSDVR